MLHMQLGRLANSIQAKVLKRLTSDNSNAAAPSVVILSAMLSFVKENHRSREGALQFQVLTEGLQRDFSASSLQVKICLVQDWGLVEKHVILRPAARSRVDDLEPLKPLECMLLASCKCLKACLPGLNAL